MINQKVITDITWLFSFFQANPFVIIGSFFTIYFAIQKMTTKVGASFAINNNRLYDSYISNIIFTNKRDKAITISSITAKFNFENKVTLLTLESPELIKAYETVKIEIPNYSKLYSGNGEVKLNAMDNINIFITTTTGKVIYCENDNHVDFDPSNQALTVHTVKYEGIVLTENFAYIFTYISNNQTKSLCIDKGNFFHRENPFPFNSFGNTEINQGTFSAALINYGIHDSLENYVLVEVTPHLKTNFLLNKSIVEDIRKKSLNPTHS